MSGSPVFIDGKLVGAIAFSFPFSKEPIAGITPIKQMIDLFNKGSENENLNPGSRAQFPFHNLPQPNGNQVYPSQPFRLFRWLARSRQIRRLCRCLVNK